MSFVQTSFLIATAAVTIPVIVHLLSRWQVRRLELGTMRFLHEVIQDGAQRRRIRRWLLLFTRAALMLLLALLFARPYLTEKTSLDGNRLRIVLIDRSASMGMQGQEGRLIDDAVAAAIENVSELGEDSTVVWAWFDRHVHPMAKDTIRPVPPTAAVGDTNYVAALRWARDKLTAYPGAVADVVLVTDLQQSGFQSDSVDKATLAFPTDVPVNVVDVGRPAASNLAITSVVPITKILKSQQPVKLAVTLFNYGSLPFEEVPATVSASSETRTVRLKKTINIQNGEAEEVSFDFGQLEPGTWQVTVALDVADDLAVDNQRYTALQVVDPIDILVVDSGSSSEGSAAKSYFLATALEQDKSDFGKLAETTTLADRMPGRFRAESIFLQEEPIRVLDAVSHPLVVVADAGSLTEEMIQRLENYVSSGGELLVFASDITAGNSPLWQQSGLAPGIFDTPRRSGAMPFRIASINNDAAMMKPFEDPQHADLSRLAFYKMLPVDVAKATKVLAWFDQQRPALTEHRRGNGRVVWFLSSADSSWGNWTTSPLYLPLVQQMAADLLNLTGEGLIRFRSVGDDRTTGMQNAAAQYITVSLQDSPADSVAESTFDQPGFVTNSDVLFVVNGSSKESDPARIEPTAFVEHFGLTVPAEGASETVQRVESDKRKELWPWLAAAALVLVMTEFCLSNRTTA